MSRSDDALKDAFDAICDGQLHDNGMRAWLFREYYNLMKRECQVRSRELEVSRTTKNTSDTQRSVCDNNKPSASHISSHVGNGFP